MNIPGMNVTEEQYKKTLEDYLNENSIYKPYKHQVEGVFNLLKNPKLLLADEMGLGKTKQVIDAAQCLFMQGGIDRVLIICPGSIRSVWFDPELGEWAKHMWRDFPLQVAEYRNKIKIWKTTEDKDRLKVVVTNFEFLRKDKKLEGLRGVVGPRTMLVVDESSYVTNHRAQQTRAVRSIRKFCGRVVLMNGTPITEGVTNIFSQAYILDPKILGYKTPKAFRSNHVEMGGWNDKQVLKYKNVDYIQRRMAPFVLRRLKEHCLDLPAKIPPVRITVTLDKKTWGLYKQMQDEFIAWLHENEASTSTHAAVRAIRLQQITSGFLGGIQAQRYNEDGELVDVPDEVLPTQRIGFEKEHALIEWMKDRLSEDESFKAVIWGRFTLEIEGILSAFRSKLPEVELGVIRGGQKEAERNEAKRLLDPRTAPKGPAVVVGNPASGGMGLTLVAASSMMYVSNYWRLITRLQSEDRIHRPGQVKHASYFDLIAVGPNGQRTIDRSIIQRMENKQSLATMTSAAWLSELEV
jgi:SNF2 family DNA or RNA helicase